MGAKLLLAAMLLGTPTVMVLGARDDAPAPAPAAPRYQEKPWLTHEAAAQLIAPDGAMGPLFAGVILGGSAPPTVIRERIAAFANEHDVDIDLELEDGNVASVKLGVTFDGGFGYEGADVLALRFDRPSRGKCCVCGPSDYWFNDWGLGLADGTYVHASVRVNRFEAHWVAGMTTAEVLELAESLVGARMSDVRRRYGRRVYDHALEIPYANAGPPLVIAYGDFAMTFIVTDGRIEAVRARLRNWESAHEQENKQVVLQRYGRPRKDGNENGTWWSWQRRDMLIDADTYDDIPSAVSFTLPQARAAAL